MKRKIAVVVIIVVVLAILLTPVQRLRYKDGGSVEYKALAYSVTKYHRVPLPGSDKYREGWKIEIFGITIRDDIPD